MIYTMITLWCRLHEHIWKYEMLKNMKNILSISFVLWYAYDYIMNIMNIYTYSNITLWVIYNISKENNNMLWIHGCNNNTTLLWKAIFVESSELHNYEYTTNNTKIWLQNKQSHLVE